MARRRLTQQDGEELARRFLWIVILAAGIGFAAGGAIGRSLALSDGWSFAIAFIGLVVGNLLGIALMAIVGISVDPDGEATAAERAVSQLGSVADKVVGSSGAERHP